METECKSKQFEFEGLGNRKVVGSFDGGALTSDGGAAGRSGLFNAFHAVSTAIYVIRIHVAQKV